MQNSGGVDDDEVLSVIMMLCTSALLGMGTVVTLFAPLRQWAMNSGLFAPGPASVITLPWDDGMGFDWGRLLILGAGLYLVVLAWAWALARRSRLRAHPRTA